MSRLSRRRFLRAAGAGAVAGLAGCSAPTRRNCRPGPGAIDTPAQALPTAIFRQNLDRQGVEAAATVPDAVRVDWRLPGVNTGKHTAAKSSPVPSPTGDVLVAGDNGEIRSVRPTGSVRWAAETYPSKWGIHGTPVVANGAAYVGAYDGALYAFDVETGERLWCANLGDAIGSSPAYHDGTVYVAVEYAAPSGAFFGVDAVTGETVWESRRPTDQPHSSVAIDRDADRLVVGANDGVLYCYRYPDLEFAWSFPTGAPIKGPIATYDGAAFFGSWDHIVYRLALEDGAVDWRFEAGDKVMSGASVDPRTGTVYAGSHDTNLYALDATTGAKRWAFGTGGWLIGCPTVTAEHVLVGSYDTNVYAVDRERGTETWRVANVGWVTSTPLVHDGAIYYAERATPERAGAAYRLVSGE